MATEANVIMIDLFQIPANSGRSASKRQENEYQNPDNTPKEPTKTRQGWNPRSKGGRGRRGGQVGRRKGSGREAMGRTSAHRQAKPEALVTGGTRVKPHRSQPKPGREGKGGGPRRKEGQKKPAGTSSGAGGERRGLTQGPREAQGRGGGRRTPREEREREGHPAQGTQIEHPRISARQIIAREEGGGGQRGGGGHEYLNDYIQSTNNTATLGAAFGYLGGDPRGGRGVKPQKNQGAAERGGRGRGDKIA